MDFDVSDYRTLLADSVHIAAGNWQELLDMQFFMIKGTPPRDVVDIQNLCTWVLLITDIQMTLLNLT
ncbi:MAG: hypothetical protein IPG89_05940 [Bacteroidetes bacterium]|nr:hypothetical protein [Bacteroidota bacterium]